MGLVVTLIWGRSPVMRVLAITGIVAGIAYVFTPLTASGGLGQPTGFDANLRYVAPPLVIALAITPLVPTLRRRPWPWVLIGFFAGVPAGLHGGSDHRAELEVRPLVRVPGAGDPDRGRVPAVLVAPSRPGIRRSVLAGVGIAALVVDGGHRANQEEQYLDHRYRANVAPQLDRRLPIHAGVDAAEVRPRGPTPASPSSAAPAPSASTSSTATTSPTGSSTGQGLAAAPSGQIDDCNDLRATRSTAGDYDYIVTTPPPEPGSRPRIFWVGGERRRLARAAWNVEAIVVFGLARTSSRSTGRSTSEAPAPSLPVRRSAALMSLGNTWPAHSS